MVGGVCSGLAAYFGITDPVWVRLFFVLLLMGGVGGVLYIVMMIIVPKAKTSADRLAMKGEPVNIQSIADAVEKQFQEISDKLAELGNDLSRKKK
ncbi:MAG: PspC domain-containing protein [Saprospiraceae bacterium]|nr:PspC domain-containing protein [Saprospiraceae bacterium]